MTPPGGQSGRFSGNVRSSLASRPATRLRDALPARVEARLAELLRESGIPHTTLGLDDRCGLLVDEVVAEALLAREGAHCGQRSVDEPPEAKARWRCRHRRLFVQGSLTATETGPSETLIRLHDGVSDVALIVRSCQPGGWVLVDHERRSRRRTKRDWGAVTLAPRRSEPPHRPGPPDPRFRRDCG